MLRELKTNQNGIVLLTVILIIMALMVVTVSVLSLNVTHGTRVKEDVRSIQADALAMGAIALMYANQQTASAGNQISYTENLPGTGQFNVIVDLDASGGLTASVTY